jgi:hypothetical protein
MWRPVFRRIGPMVWVVVLMAGCGQSSAWVEGEVTYDGQPVGNGGITFLPADGKGPSAGGKIQNGRYTVADLPPGPKIVQVEAVKAVSFARTSDEMARMAAANKARGDGSGIIDRADIIPPNAEGNNARVEIKPGKQTLNIHIKKPGGSKGA